MDYCYFFTDVDTLLTQSSGKAFGDLTDLGTSEKFQITSRHNCQLGSKAYAVVEGLIMVQQNASSSDLVNIILKPSKQSIENINISYFVYRGINKASLFENSLIKTSGNDLALEINKTIQSLNQRYPTQNHSPEEYILGYGSAADNDFINGIASGSDINLITLDAVFNVANLLYQPFTIKGGAHIGNFYSEFGIDVILEKANSNLNEARKDDNLLTSQKLGGLTGEDFILNKQEKEKILNYFDICQFYSLNYQKGGIKVKNQADTKFTKIKATNDSDNRIVTLLNKFNNNDVLFLDIRNEYNNSLNFQNNIVGSLSVKLDDTAPNLINYPDWPLIKVQIEGVNNIYIRIPKSDFSGVRAYFRENNKNSYSFKAINFDSSDYSTEFKLNVSKSPNNTSLSTFFYFMFLKEIDNDLFPSEWVIKPRHFVDTLFDIEELLYTDASENLKIKGTTYFNKPTKWKINEDNRFTYLSEASFIAKTGVAEDVDNMYFFAFSNGDSLQTSSVDIPIVTGQSDEENFLEHILLPKFHGVFSIYSYLLTHNTEAKYVLKDNINYSSFRTNTKFSSNKNGLICLAIDKAESVTKLTNAYLEFNNNLPKRIILSEFGQITSDGGKKYWEASIFVTGYANNTSTNSYEAKSVDTTIKLVFHLENQQFLGTNIFNENYAKNGLEINAMNFGGVIFKNIEFSLRTHPYSYNDVNIIARTGLEEVRFNVLGKIKIDDTPETEGTQAGVWYYIELLNDVIDSMNYINFRNVIIASKGTKCFIHENASPTIFVRYDKFIEDLNDLNIFYDNQISSQNDTLDNRIKRIRQRSHNSDVYVFEAIIAGTWFTDYSVIEGGVYKNDIQYEIGETYVEEIQSPNLVLNINLDIQLFHDYAGVEFYNGEVADIQHLMVGMEILSQPDTIQLLHFGNVLNYNIALYSGDAGSVAASLIDIEKVDHEENIEAKKFINKLYNFYKRNDPDDPVDLNPIVETMYYEYLQNKQFPRYDMIGNLYSFGLFYYKDLMLYITNSEDVTSQISTSQRIRDIFDFFNSYIDISEEKSIEYFYKILGLNPITTIELSGQNSQVLERIISDTEAFSKVWYYGKIQSIPIIMMTPDEEAKNEAFSKISILDFIEFVNKIFLKYK